MDNSADKHVASDAPSTTPQRARPPARAVRLPSVRAGALLAAVMLGVGIAAGAAIGPGPESSLAGGAGVINKLPALIAGLAARSHTQAPASAPAPPPPRAIRTEATPATAAAPATAGAPAPTTTTPAPQTETPASTGKSPSAGSTVPPVTNVWLIQLAGVSFSEAIATPGAAPYITGQLVPKGTLLSGWSALDASAFASDAALVEHRASVGAPPPLLHSIVQPPCPEGSAGAACASGPGQLTAADEFLKATLATITNTTTYSEHGLIVVTFATVANPTASELTAGTASATLTTQPPAGALLLSPFASAGAKSTVTFNAASPKQSLEKLLH